MMINCFISIIYFRFTKLGITTIFTAEIKIGSRKTDAKEV